MHMCAQKDRLTNICIAVRCYLKADWKKTLILMVKEALNDVVCVVYTAP